MNKIVCNVCGTSYPESAAQCPICGYVQTADSTTSDATSTYTYVKGGRFSKANVKKRNQAKAIEASDSSAAVDTHSEKAKANIGSIIIIVILLLAIVAVIGYIALRFLVPNDFLFDGLGNLKQPAVNQGVGDQTPIDTYEPATDSTDLVTNPTESLACRAVELNTTDIQFDSIGKSFVLEVSLDPVNTLDTVNFASSDMAVAIVDESGTITSVGAGNAVITVTCGSVSTTCNVECILPDEKQLNLNRKEITFNAEGQSWLLYDGEIPLEEITWTSDDNQIATIENGKVIAVANGSTNVFGVYKDQIVACVIHCDFDDTAEEGSGAVTEANGDPSKTYRLYNPYGYADDVSISVGESFTLKLVDESLNDADGVQWSVKNESVCVFSGNQVKGVGSGTTEIVATCAGKTYTCTVRVR